MYIIQGLFGTTGWQDIGSYPKSKFDEAFVKRVFNDLKTIRQDIKLRLVSLID